MRDLSRRVLLLISKGKKLLYDEMSSTKYEKEPFREPLKTIFREDFYEKRSESPTLLQPSFAKPFLVEPVH